MGRPNRQVELRRYKRFLYERLADQVRDHDPVMHPDFALTDEDAGAVQDEVAAELLEARPLLMVAANTRPGVRGPDEEAEEPGYCLGLRFCYPDEVAHVEKLLVTQVRKHYSVYTGMTPKGVRQALHFTVYRVPNPPTRGGWPQWLGPTAYYT